MAILKEHDLPRLLAKPDGTVPVILVHGRDHGLVGESFAALIKAYGAETDDPFALVQLDGAELDREPDRLVNEVMTVSMFGGNRVIGVRASGSKTIDRQVEAVLSVESAGGIVIIAAGDLKKTQPLRQRIERHRRALAVPCYNDDGPGLDRLIEAELGEARSVLTSEARVLLRSVLGADRLASRQELRKLRFYAEGSDRIDVEAVMAAVSDAGVLALDAFIEAVAGGDPGRAEHEFDRLTASGMAPTAIATATLRHLQALDAAIAVRASGGSIEDALRSFRPPPFRDRRDAAVRQIKLWSGGRIATAADVVYRAIADARRNSELGAAILSQGLISVARVAKSLRR